MQSTRQWQAKPPLHVALIMDGNGRWATARGLPREAGHRAGVAALRAVVEAAPRLGVTTLSAYAFSTDNWRRPSQEVALLMGIFRRFLKNEIARLAEAGVRLKIMGRRDRLPDGIADLIVRAEAATAEGTSLDLGIAIDYSGRDSILAAVATASPAGNACASRRLWCTSSVAVEAFSVMKCRPGTPSAMRRAPSSVACSIPMRRTAALSSATAWMRSPTSFGNVPPLRVTIRSICAARVTGMSPAMIGMSHPALTTRSRSRR